MSDVAVRVEHISKMYQLGVINGGTLRKDIQTWLRHADIGTTMNTYLHLDFVDKKNIAKSLNKRFTAIEKKIV